MAENIFEEDAKSDNMLYNEANEVYKQAVDIVYKQIDTSKRKIIYAGDSMSTAVLNCRGQILGVCFELGESTDGSLGRYDSQLKIIILYLPDLCYLDDLIVKTRKSEISNEKQIGVKSNTFKYLLADKDVKEVFIHEYTHFVDDIQNFPMAKQHVLKKNREASYHNKDTERNAWYIEWLDAATRALTEKYKTSMDNLTSEQRLDFIKEICWKNGRFMNYYNYLTPENKKRFMRRLYNYLSSDIWK